jgi:trehalose-6-phosphatase
MKYLKSFENISERKFKKGDTIICVKDDIIDEDVFDENVDIKEGEKYIIYKILNTPDWNNGLKVQNYKNRNILYGYWPSENFVYPEDYETYVNTQKYNI